MFNFEPAERTLAYAEAHNQTVRCHNLVWYTSLPSYINASVPKVGWRGVVDTGNKLNTL